MSTSQTRRLTHQINVGLSQSEAKHIDEAARVAGISRAAFARRHVLAAVGQIDRTQPRSFGTALPPEEVAAVATLAGSVGRAAGAAVQLSKALRETGHGSFHALAERVLTDLRRQSAELAAIIERMK